MNCIGAWDTKLLTITTYQLNLCVDAIVWPIQDVIVPFVYITTELQGSFSYYKPLAKLTFQIASLIDFYKYIQLANSKPIDCS